MVIGLVTLDQVNAASVVGTTAAKVVRFVNKAKHAKDTDGHCGLIESTGLGNLSWFLVLPSFLDLALALSGCFSGGPG